MRMTVAYSNVMIVIIKQNREIDRIECLLIVESYIALNLLVCFKVDQLLQIHYALMGEYYVLFPI